MLILISRMKLKSLFLHASLLFVSIGANANPFHLEKNEIEQEFKQVNTIEQMVETNQIGSLDELKNNSPELYAGFTKNAATFSITDETDPLGIPSFFWGCCFGAIGILIVAVVSSNDKSAIKKAAIGCAVSYGTLAIVYIIAIASGALTAYSY